jgi:polysaccharide export outer membrane protein
MYQAQTPAVQTPTPRGVFTQGGPMARGAGYRQPVYQQPVYQQPVYQQPVYQPPVYQAPAYPAVVPAQPCAASGCQGGGYPGGAYAGYPSQINVEQPYTLDAGDRLRISVFGQEGLTNSYAVDAAGHITMPLIGTLQARGLTTDQLSQSISERLRQGFIREPHVAIEVEAYRPFFIHGEVGNPGQYPYVANMTVENAIAIAGGFGPRADKSKISLSRTLGGQTTKGTVGLNYPMRPGDTLRIQERWF